MNKGYIYGAVTAASAAMIAGALVVRKKKINDNEPDNLELAGIPDQLKKENEKLEQLENAKMVSEGSQFGVQYYNEIKEDEEDMVTPNE